MSRLIKYLWFLTVLALLASLLWIYASLPNEVGVLANEFGEADEFLEKNQFFYVFFGFFALINIILFGLHNMIINHTDRFSHQINPSRRSLQLSLSQWMLAFASSLNIFFILALIYLAAFNSAEVSNLQAFQVLVYVGPVLVGLVLLSLVFIFLKKRA